jgi:aryl-alcohol dehydrogenase-like predicted oxidoreductase
VIIKEALANGRLTGRGDIQLLAQAARSLGATPDALALAAALAQPWAHVVLSGASTAEMLRSNLVARELAVPEDLWDRLEPLREDSFAYWKTRAGLPWN